jgi:Fe-S-cluster containining protein
VPALPGDELVTALARYRRHLAAVARRFTRLAARHRRDVACRPGCFGCCVGLFEISSLDAAVAAEGLAALPKDRREAIARRGEAIARRFAESFPGSPDTLALDVAREGEWDRFFEKAATIACPFLEPIDPRSRTTAPAAARKRRWPRGFACAIYAHRPHACRTFGLPLAERGRIVSDPCRLNFRAGPPEAIAAAALPVYEPKEDAIARAGEAELGLMVDAATILPAVASGRYSTGVDPMVRSRRGPRSGKTASAGPPAGKAYR